MVIISVSKIRVQYKGEFIKIRHHPYYISLKNDNKQYYELCIAKSEKAQRVKETASFSGLKKLVKNIKTNGFDVEKASFSLTPLSRGRYVAKHGRHRMCILRYLYSRNAKIELSDSGHIISIIQSHHK